MGRSPCCDKNGIKKGPWTPEEDLKLTQYIQMHGPGNWRTLPKNAGLQRCGKSCRLRWSNYLRPDIKRGRFSFEEEESIIQLHSVLGNKWSAIAARLPGRTDNEIKNYWNTHIRKRLLRMGIDPAKGGNLRGPGRRREKIWTGRVMRGGLTRRGQVGLGWAERKPTSVTNPFVPAPSVTVEHPHLSPPPPRPLRPNHHNPPPPWTKHHRSASHRIETHTLRDRGCRPPPLPRSDESPVAN
ncbi:hypothetical protein BUALT_Bualt03G0201100 [Buddleja alternifolia]|uniref:Uncharacterized protein n=1 Tax=Buddleja alternifolia TaxID=168488 RepID=A0AAV6Y255_9LAMI|nr:hypothetical protein BUALT_Bualt03G0201100 [Buddleja alternifolia]